MPWIPNCPRCSGETDIKAQGPHVPHTVTHGVMHQLQHAGKAHPVIAVAALVGMGGIALWARMGAEKQCKRCGHTFK